MKKLMAILLAVLMLIPLIASCGGNYQTTTTEIPTTEAPTTETPTTETPTTEAPTTETPTTEIPTTEAPTTEAPTTKYEYNIYEVGGYANFSRYGLTHECELDENPLRTYKKDPTVPDTMTVEYEGVQYECVYTESKMAYGFVHYDTYSCTVSSPNGDLARDFGLDRDTKEIVYLDHFKGSNYVIPPLSEDALSYDKIMILGENFLKKYVTDPESYVLTKNKLDIYHCRTLIFNRFIDGIKTFDEVSVTIDPNGNIWGFDITSVNKLKGYEFAEAFDEENLTQAVTSKLDKIYAEAFKNAGATKSDYEFESTLVKLANGQYAILYDVWTYFHLPNKRSGDYCNILAYLP